MHICVYNHEIDVLAGYDLLYAPPKTVNEMSCSQPYKFVVIDLPHQTLHSSRILNSGGNAH